MSSYNRYGQTDEEAAARSRASVDHTGYSRRSIADGAMTFTQWSERQRMRDKAAGIPTTEAEVIAAWDAAYPHQGKHSQRGRESAEKLEAELRASRMPPPEPAAEIGRPTRW